MCEKCTAYDNTFRRYSDAYRTIDGQSRDERIETAIEQMKRDQEAIRARNARLLQIGDRLSPAQKERAQRVLERRGRG